MVEASPAGNEPRPNRRHTIRRWALELLLMLGVYLVIVTWQERHLVRVHEPAPPFTLEALDGRSVSLDSLKGKRVLVHFWATWCGVCRHEFGALNAVAGSLGKDEVLLSVVADADDPERIQRFVAEHGIRYPVLLGTDAVLRAFRIDTFPTNYYLDKSGAIAGHTIGMSTRVSLASRLGCAR